MLIPALAKTISLALSLGHVRLVLVALTVRNEETLTYFLDEIGAPSLVHNYRHQ